MPELAEAAERVVVFQRTPNYVLPSPNGPVTANAERERTDQPSELRTRIRESALGMPYALSGRMALDVSAEERNAIFEEGWKNGGFRFLVETFDDLWLDSAANATAAEFIRNKIRSMSKTH